MKTRLFPCGGVSFKKLHRARKCVVCKQNDSTSAPYLQMGCHPDAISRATPTTTRQRLFPKVIYRLRSSLQIQ